MPLVRMKMSAEEQQQRDAEDRARTTGWATDDENPWATPAPSPTAPPPPDDWFTAPSPEASEAFSDQYI